MTIIAACHIETFCAISDTLITAPVSSENDVQIDLPFCGIRSVRAGASRMVSANQKSIIITPHDLIQWAGLEIAGESIVRALYEWVASGRDLSVDTVIAIVAEQLDGMQDGKVSLIYSSIRNGTVSIHGFCAETNKLGDKPITYAGSGSYDFIFDFDTKDVALKSGCEELFSRLVMTGLRESTLNSSLDSAAYGGWFELTICKEGEFYKAPYLIVLWSIIDGALTPDLIWDCHYEGFDLIIRRYPAHGDAAKEAVFRIPDLLHRRSEVFPLHNLDFLQAHIIINDNGNGDLVTIARDYSKFYVCDDESGRIIYYTNEFRQYLLDEMSNQNKQTIYKPSDKW